MGGSSEMQTQTLFYSKINEMKAITRTLSLGRRNQEWQKNSYQNLDGKQASKVRAMEECFQSLLKELANTIAGMLWGAYWSFLLAIISIRHSTVHSTQGGWRTVDAFNIVLTHPVAAGTSQLTLSPARQDWHGSLCLSQWRGE